ncbi:MAG TPA: hypothetical protein VJV22_05520, partial [Acidobacteriaceae bacterium]|nr:hypothetical protein [Acidobacteriaceae bacterium]
SKSAEQSRPCRRDESRYAGPMRQKFDVRDALAEWRFSEPEADLQQRGKVARENTFVLSSDGKTVRETGITPAPSPSKRSVTLYKSQRRTRFFLFGVRQVPATGDLPVDQIFW